jgi:hypothetical protein
MDLANAKRSDIAADLIERYGFRLIPCKADSKEPAIPRGVHSASDDVDQVRKWLDALTLRDSKPNIGIACGQGSVVVVDIDPRTNQDAFLNACELCGHDNAEMWQPDTVIVDTPSGGQHWYFQAPDFPVKNYTGIVPGVDLKADNGYVIAAGSSINGRRYDYSRDGAIASVPDALLKRLSSAAKRPDNSITYSEVHGVAVTEGGRNAALTKLTGSLWNAGLRADELYGALSVRNKAYQPPLPNDEVWRIVKSAERNFERKKTATKLQNRLLKLSDLQAMPRPIPLISDVLFSDMEHCLFGPQGTSKTFLSLDWALHIVHGRRWMDKNVQPGRVVYVCGEGGGRVLGDRLDAWLEHHGISDRSAVEERLRITESPVHLLDHDAVDELLRLIHEYGEVVLVIIDTLSANFGAGNENDQADMGRFCGAARRIRLETKAGIVVVHHTGHANKMRPQGANRIRRDFDIELRVDVDDNEDELFGLMGGGKLKNRNGKGCGLIPYRLKTVHLDDDGGFDEAVESAVVVPTEDQPNFEGQHSAPASGRGKNQLKVIEALTYMAEKSGQPLDSEDGVLLSTFELAAALKQSDLPKKRWNEVLRNFTEKGITQPSVGGIKWYPQ